MAGMTRRVSSRLSLGVAEEALDGPAFLVGVQSGTRLGGGGDNEQLPALDALGDEA